MEGGVGGGPRPDMNPTAPCRGAEELAGVALTPKSTVLLRYADAMRLASSASDPLNTSGSAMMPRSAAVETMANAAALGDAQR